VIDNIDVKDASERALFCDESPDEQVKSETKNQQLAKNHTETTKKKKIESNNEDITFSSESQFLGDDNSMPIGDHKFIQLSKNQ